MSFPQDSDYVGVQFLDQGSDLTAPAASRLRVYSKSGELYKRNSAGTVEKFATSAGGMADAVILAPGTSTRDRIQATADVVPFSIRRFSAGSVANQFQVENEVGTPLTWIGSDGRAIINNKIEILGSAPQLFIDGSTVSEIYMRDQDAGVDLKNFKLTNNNGSWGLYRLTDAFGLAGTILEFNTVGVMTAIAKDAATNSVTNVLSVKHHTTGTPAAGFGIGQLFYGHSSNNTEREMGRIRYLWTTATDASRVSQAVFSVYNVGTEQDILYLNANPAWASFTVPSVYINAAAGVDRTLFWQSTGVVRWGLRVNSVAESGSNAGSDFVIDRYGDGGSFIESAFAILRNTGQSYHTYSDATTNVIANVFALYRATSGTPAAGFGTGILVHAHSGNSTVRELGRLRWHWTVATDASRTARGTLSAYDTAERDCIAWEASGSGPMIGLNGNAPVARSTYGAPTGTATRTTFDTTTVTLAQLAERVKAMIDDFRSRGDFA